MLKGHTFSEQVFANTVFRLFMNVFLDGNNGIIQGCEMNNSANNITIGAGYFCVQGGFLEIVGEEQVEVTSNDAFCKLVCEIDLSKTNTETDFLQASFKVIKSTTAYPSVTQENLFNKGNIYQFEFAQFKTSANGISEFKDTRKKLEFKSIYKDIKVDVKELIEELKTEIANVKDGSAYMLTSKIKTGSEYPVELEEGQIYLQYFEEE